MRIHTQIHADAHRYIYIKKFIYYSVDDNNRRANKDRQEISRLNRPQ